jgi:hypothetical protein
MQRLLCARVRFRKDGVLHEGWHACDVKHNRQGFAIGCEVITGHIVESLAKLDVGIDEVVSIEIMWAQQGSWQWSTVSMLLPDVRTNKVARRYYTIQE